jgi:hypothetical protein
LGLQEGAKKIADAENIIEVQLFPDSTPYEYLMRFLNNVMLGVHETITVKESVVVIKMSNNGN